MLYCDSKNFPPPLENTTEAHEEAIKKAFKIISISDNIEVRSLAKDIFQLLKFGVMTKSAPTMTVQNFLCEAREIAKKGKEGSNWETNICEEDFEKIVEEINQDGLLNSVLLNDKLVFNFTGNRKVIVTKGKKLFSDSNLLN